MKNQLKKRLRNSSRASSSLIRRQSPCGATSGICCSVIGTSLRPARSRLASRHACSGLLPQIVGFHYLTGVLLVPAAAPDGRQLALVCLGGPALSGSALAWLERRGPVRPG